MPTRRRRPGGRRAARAHPPISIQEDSDRLRQSVLATALWTLATLIGLVVLGGLLVIGLTTGLSAGRLRGLVGALILLGVLVFAGGAKAAQAFISWREAGAKESHRA